jgi:hypothetical protein
MGEFMARFSVRVVTLCASIVAMGFGIEAALAQDCKDEVSSSGKARPTEGWAKSLAIHMWSRQVQAAYGEQYEDFQYAKRQNVVCSPTTLGKRCTVTAVPCIVPSSGPGGSHEVREEEREREHFRDDEREDSFRGDRLTFRLQRELQRVGCYDGEVDGAWGDMSRRALERFARRTDTRLDVDQPTRKALEKVEGADERVCRER